MTTDYTRSEIVAGVFVLGGLTAIAYLSISIGGTHAPSARSYHVTARFSNVGDLKLRAPVKIAGVTVGQVRSIRLADYYGEVEVAVDRKVALPRDTIASISTSGLLGESFLSLSPGAADEDLPDGGRITQTEPALNVADLLARYAFGSKGDQDTDTPPSDAKSPAHGEAQTKRPAPPPARDRTPASTPKEEPR